MKQEASRMGAEENILLRTICICFMNRDAFRIQAKETILTRTMCSFQDKRGPPASVLLMKEEDSRIGAEENILGRSAYVL